MCRPSLAWVLVPAAVLFSGCFDYSEVLELAADGSGRLTIEQTIDVDVFEQLRELVSSTKPDAERELPDFSREWIEKAIGEREGLRLVEYSSEDQAENGARRRKVRIVLEFDRPDALVVSTGAFVLRPFTLEHRPGPEGAAGTVYEFARKIGVGPEDIQEFLGKRKKKEPADGADSGQSAPQGDAKKDAWALDEDSLAGFRTIAQSVAHGKTAVFELRMPGAVRETNIEEGKGLAEGPRAVWRFDLSELLANSKELRATAVASEE